MKKNSAKKMEENREGKGGKGDTERHCDNRSLMTFGLGFCGEGEKRTLQVKLEMKTTIKRQTKVRIVCWSVE